MNSIKALLVLVMSISFILGCQKKTIELFVYPPDNLEYSANEQNHFTSLEKAVQKAQTQYQGEDVTIHLLPGEYHLASPVKIKPGLNSLSIKGSSSENTFVKGSRQINVKWKKYNDNLWETEIITEDDFDQFYIDNEQKILARYPNYDESGGHWQGHAADAISPERIKSWKNPKGAIVHITHKAEWGDFHYIITGTDEKGEAILSGGHQNNRPENGLHQEYRMVENVFEELDSPNEYYFDKIKKKLYFYPPSDLDLNLAKVEITVLKHLIEVLGTENELVSNLNMSGINFSHTKRTIMEKYHKLLRSDWAMYRGGAIIIEGAENININNCELEDLGGNGIFVNSFNRNINITGNHIHDLGASGISFVGDISAVRSPSFYYYEFVPIAEMDTVIGPKNNLYPSNCFVSNNLIHRTGRIEKQTSGVQISMAMDITVSHNSIYDVPRAGINISEGTWGGHIIEYNDVFNTVLETGDHGSFNSWGRDRFWHPNRKVLDSLVAQNPNMPKWDAIHTTIIRNNRFRCDHGWDIDLDDGSSNYEIYNNLCLNGGIKLREGFYRTVEKNIMVNNSFHPHVWFKNSGDVFRKNIVMTDYKDIRLQGWGKEIDFNLFPTELALKKAQQNGTDANSVFGDPIFVNPEKGDFSVDEHSPALKLRFENFPMQGFGVISPELKTLAKQPQIPELFISAFQKNNLKIRNWLGAKIKNIETLGERSASGLEKEEGVLVLDVDKNSLSDKAGMKKGDVITKCEETDIKKMSDLLSSYQGNNWKGHLKLIVYRNQSETELQISTK